MGERDFRVLRRTLKLCYKVLQHDPEWKDKKDVKYLIKRIKGVEYYKPSRQDLIIFHSAAHWVKIAFAHYIAENLFDERQEAFARREIKRLNKISKKIEQALETVLY